MFWLPKLEKIGAIRMLDLLYEIIFSFLPLCLALPSHLTVLVLLPRSYSPIYFPPGRDGLAAGRTLEMLVIWGGLVDVCRAGWKAPRLLPGVKPGSQSV